MIRPYYKEPCVSNSVRDDYLRCNWCGRDMAALRRGALFVGKIAAELDRAYAKHGREPWGRHEFYAILLEEVDELWDAIKGDRPQEEVEAELTEVAAMCFRYFETGDRYRVEVKHV